MVRQDKFTTQRTRYESTSKIMIETSTITETRIETKTVTETRIETKTVFR